MTAPKRPRYGYVPPTPSDDTSPLTKEETRDALCIQIGDPELFFAERGGDYRDAEKVCAGCPIAARCLAVYLDEPDGFFAASPPQRKKIRERLDTVGTMKPTLGEFWAGEVA